MEQHSGAIKCVCKGTAYRMTRQFISGRQSLVSPKFELTSLIDVVFILVLFFAVSTSFQHERRVLKLTLPSSKSIETPKKSITISIDRNQRIYWNGKRISEATISKRVQHVMEQTPNHPIILQADKVTPYLRVVSVLDAIRNSGCTSVMLETKQS